MEGSSQRFSFELMRSPQVPRLALTALAGVTLGLCFASITPALFILALLSGLLLVTAFVGWPVLGAIALLASAVLVPSSIFLRVGIAITFPRLCILLVIAALVVLALQDGIRREDFRTPLTGWFGAFLAAALASLLSNLPSMDLASGLAAGKVLGNYVGNVGLFFALLWALCAKGRKHLTLLEALVAVAALSAIIGIAEFVLHKYLIASFIRNFPLGGIEAEEYLAVVERDRMREGSYQVTSTLEYSLSFGMVMAVTAPVALALAQRAAGAAKKAWLWGCAAILLTAVLLTVQRTPIVALMIELGVMAALTRKLRPFFLSLLGLSILAAAGTLVFPEVFESLLARLFPAGGLFADPTVGSRLRSLEWIPGLVARNPIFGLGPGALLADTYLQQHRDLPVIIEAVDNYFLAALGELGLVGLIALLALLGRIWFLLVRPFRGQGGGSTLQAALAAGFAGFVLFNLSFEAFTQMGCVAVASVIVLAGLFEAEPAARGLDP